MKLVSVFEKQEYLSERFASSIGLLQCENHTTHSLKYYINAIEKYLKRIKCIKGYIDEPIFILDIGCGKRSWVTKDIKKRYNCILYAMDISLDELIKNKVVDHKIVYDACNNRYDIDLEHLKNAFDLIISNMVLEHLKNTTIAHKMIYFLLNNTGIVIHRYPTLYDPLLLVNHLIPNQLSTKVLSKLEPFRRKSGKFKAYYNNCRGLSRNIQLKYCKIGMKVIEGHNFYGTTYLYRVFPLQAVMDIFYFLLTKLKITAFTSSSCVILMKKGNPSTELINPACN